MKKSIVTIKASILSVAVVGLAQAAPQYTAIDLGTLGGVNSQHLASAGFGINNSGQITGASILSDNTTNHAFLYSGGPLQDLGTLSGDTSSLGLGINDVGHVVGQSSGSGFANKHAFLYSAGIMHDLGTLGGATGLAVAINNVDQIVGNADTSAGDSHAFLYSGGAMHDLGTLGGVQSGAVGINDAGQIVGAADTSSGDEHAFLYSGGSIQDLDTLGGSQSLAFGINSSSEIVGGSEITGDTNWHAFLYSGGTMQDLGTLHGHAATATSINSSGAIVGTFFPANSIIGGKGSGGNPVGAFLYLNQTMYNLNRLVPGSHANFVAAFGINDNGQIVADGRLTNGQIHAFLLTPVPGQLLSISTRLDVLTGNQVAIGGFTVTGSSNKQVLVRALGPTLTQFGVTGVLPDPVLTLHHTDAQGHDTIIGSNDNWKIPAANETAVKATGKAPPNDLESAAVMTLAPGAYTAVVTGKGSQTGVGLVEVYDLDQSTSAKLSNISTRGFVQTGGNVMIAGLTAGGTGPVTVLVRALGPTLSQFGVPNVLANPQLELHDENGALVASNDNWISSPQKAEIQASGYAPPNNLEPAIISTRPAGNTTAIVNGVNNTTGNALVESYVLP